MAFTSLKVRDPSCFTDECLITNLHDRQRWSHGGHCEACYTLQDQLNPATSDESPYSELKRPPECPTSKAQSPSPKGRRQHPLLQPANAKVVQYMYSRHRVCSGLQEVEVDGGMATLVCG